MNRKSSRRCSSPISGHDTGAGEALLRLLLADNGGLARDLSPDMEGIRTVLRLRSKYGVPQKALSDAAKYVDLSYLEKAATKR